MNIALSGYYGFDNAGDETILSAIIKLIKDYDEEINITVLSNNPEETMKTHGVHAVNRWRLFDVWRVLKRSDGLISGGGSLLQDKTGWRSVPYYLGIMQMARILKKPYVVFSQGMGPIDKWYNKFLTKRVISKSCYISVRDETSKRLLQTFGVKNTIEVIPDPVFAFGMDKTEYHEEHKRNTVAVTVRSWPSNENYIEKIALALDKVIDQGFEVTFIPMHGEDDEVVSKQLAGLMENEAACVSHQLSFREKMELIGKSNALFGMRLHSLIFAAITRTPFVALDYDPKITAFAENCSQPILGTVDDPWSAEDLYHLIMNQINHGDYVAKHLDQLASLWNNQIQQTMTTVLDKIVSLKKV